MTGNTCWTASAEPWSERGYGGGLRPYLYVKGGKKFQFNFIRDRSRHSAALFGQTPTITAATGIH